MKTQIMSVIVSVWALLCPFTSNSEVIVIRSQGESSAREYVKKGLFTSYEPSSVKVKTLTNGTYEYFFRNYTGPNGKGTIDSFTGHRVSPDGDFFFSTNGRTIFVDRELRDGSWVARTNHLATDWEGSPIPGNQGRQIVEGEGMKTEVQSDCTFFIDNSMENTGYRIIFSYQFGIDKYDNPKIVNIEIRVNSGGSMEYKPSLSAASEQAKEDIKYMVLVKIYKIPWNPAPNLVENQVRRVTKSSAKVTNEINKFTYVPENIVTRISVLPLGELSLAWDSCVEDSYKAYCSSDLKSWTNFAEVTSSTSQTEITRHVPQGTVKEFYRVEKLSPVIDWPTQSLSYVVSQPAMDGSRTNMNAMFRSIAGRMNSLFWSGNTNSPTTHAYVWLNPNVRIPSNVQFLVIDGCDNPTNILSIIGNKKLTKREIVENGLPPKFGLFFTNEAFGDFVSNDDIGEYHRGFMDKFFQKIYEKPLMGTLPHNTIRQALAHASIMDDGTINPAADSVDFVGCPDFYVDQYR